MSQTYIAFLVTLIAPWLLHMGIVIGTEELTTTITTIVAIAAALYGMYRRYKDGNGDINVFGLRN